jgi:hypothetical protein
LDKIQICVSILIRSTPLWLKTCSCLRLRTGRSAGAVIGPGFKPRYPLLTKNLRLPQKLSRANGFIQKALALKKTTTKESYALAYRNKLFYTTQ